MESVLHMTSSSGFSSSFHSLHLHQHHIAMTLAEMETFGPVNVTQLSGIQPINAPSQAASCTRVLCFRFSNIFITVIIIMKIQLSSLKHVNRNVYTDSD